MKRGREKENPPKILKVLLKIQIKTLVKMSSIALALLDELRPELVSLIQAAVESALLKGSGPQYPEKVTISQASEITGYSKNSLYQMHCRGQVPGAQKVRGKLVFDTATLREWVNNGGI